MAERILICDDSATVRISLVKMLEERYACTAVASGEELLERVDEVQPDLVLSDLWMTGINGYEVCTALRAKPRYRHVPIVLLTSDSDGESKATGLERGADDYLFKPARARELLARVASLLRLRATNLALETRTLELEKANASLVQTQQALVQSEKRAFIGTLVAGVAHELNNPLAFMSSGVNTIKEVLAGIRKVVPELSPDPAREEVAAGATEIGEIAVEVREGIDRIAAIARNLRAATASAVEPPERLDLPLIVRAVWEQAVRRAGARARLEIGIDPEVKISAPPESVSEVLLQLMVNAIQAIPTTGVVTVNGRMDRTEVLLTVQDTGTGISPDHLSRIFDPFFTTKPPGQGVGLGLSVCQGIVRSMGGTLAAASEPGRGATLTLRLPSIPPDAYNERRAQPPGHLVGSGSASRRS